jgi:hypothetical protein
MVSITVTTNLFIDPAQYLLEPCHIAPMAIMGVTMKTMVSRMDLCGSDMHTREEWLHKRNQTKN